MWVTFTRPPRCAVSSISGVPLLEPNVLEGVHWFRTNTTTNSLDVIRSCNSFGLTVPAESKLNWNKTVFYFSRRTVTFDITVNCSRAFEKHSLYGTIVQRLRKSSVQIPLSHLCGSSCGSLRLLNRREPRLVLRAWDSGNSDACYRWRRKERG